MESFFLHLLLQKKLPERSEVRDSPPATGEECFSVSCCHNVYKTPERGADPPTLISDVFFRLKVWFSISYHFYRLSFTGSGYNLSFRVGLRVWHVWFSGPAVKLAGGGSETRNPEPQTLTCTSQLKEVLPPQPQIFQSETLFLNLPS